MECSPSDSSVHGIFQARILEWVAMLPSRGSSWPRSNPNLLHWQANSLPMSHQGCKKVIHKIYKFYIRYEIHKIHFTRVKKWTSLVAQTVRIHLQWGTPGFDPWVGKIPWRRAWQATPVFLPGEAHGQSSLVGRSPWGCKELDMTERLSTESRDSNL